MKKDLDYLLTSEFDAGFKPEEFIDLLNQFKYEYRLLHSKNRSLEQHIDKLSLENENLKAKLYEEEIKFLSKIASLDDQIYFLNSSLTKNLSFQERFAGKINRKVQ